VGGGVASEGVAAGGGVETVVGGKTCSAQRQEEGKGGSHLRTH
jgi:hypothetical protein